MDNNRKERGRLRKVLLLTVLFFTLSIGLNSLSTEAAIADGIHNVKYQVNKPDSTSASMANDYFLKPAKLIVSNGTMKIQLTIKNSSWVTEFKPPGGATVISSNTAADQRVVQFNVTSLGTIKIPMKIDIDDIGYHHSYTVDFVFNSNGLPEKQATEQKPNSSTQSAGSNQSTNGSSQSKGSAPSENAKSNQSQQQVVSQKPSTQSNQSQGSNDTTNQSSETNTSEENASKEEQKNSDVTGDTAEVVENPETADSFPYIYVLLLLASIMLLVKFRNTQKN